MDQTSMHAPGLDPRTAGLILQWQSLQPECDGHPDAWRAFRTDVDRALADAMARLIELQDRPSAPGARETDLLLDATYVLERLDWCVLHRVPFGSRPARARG